MPDGDCQKKNKILWLGTGRRLQSKMKTTAPDAKRIYRMRGYKMSRLKDLRKYIDAELEKIPDADVVHHCMNDLSKEVKEKEKVRYENICREFGLE